MVRLHVGALLAVAMVAVSMPASAQKRTSGSGPSQASLKAGQC